MMIITISGDSSLIGMVLTVVEIIGGRRSSKAFTYIEEWFC